MTVGTIEELADIIVERGTGMSRCIVAIAGPPGVGKSKLSTQLFRKLQAGGHKPAIVPMDGFHLDNSTLRSRGLLDRKGAPATFDAEGFVALVADLRANTGPVLVPDFDREADRVRQTGLSVAQDRTFVLVEGNYLLLDSEPWTRLQNLFDVRVMLSADKDVLRNRLISRWLNLGFDQAGAEAKALGNDIPNASYVLAQSLPADIEYRSESEGGTSR